MLRTSIRTCTTIMARSPVAVEAGETAATVPLNGTPSLWTRLFSWLPSWKPSSERHLEEAERALLQVVNASYKDSYVPIGTNAVVRTFTAQPKQSSGAAVERHPLVMIHGFGAGFLQFYKNLEHLHSKRTLHALDLPGFGRSTRVPFTPNAQKAEEEFVDLIERWRERVGIEKFILLGHSLGAFIACSYSMKYPSRVRHLVLVDPWGFADLPSREEIEAKVTSRGSRMMWRLITAFKPFASVRAAGPWGPNLLKRMRSNLQTTFGDEFMDYIYHCNAQKPTGESAFFHMQHNIGWAKRPMLVRMGTQLDARTPVTLIYGTQSWMRFVDKTRGEEAVRIHRPSSYVGVHWVEGAGHHVHADKPEVFNTIVNGVCSLVDTRGDLATPTRGDLATPTGGDLATPTGGDQTTPTTLSEPPCD